MSLCPESMYSWARQKRKPVLMRSRSIMIAWYTPCPNPLNSFIISSASTFRAKRRQRTSASRATYPRLLHEANQEVGYDWPPIEKGHAQQLRFSFRVTSYNKAQMVLSSCLHIIARLHNMELYYMTPCNALYPSADSS